MSFWGFGGALAGAAVVTFLLSRLLLWLLKRWLGGVPRLLLAHVATLAILWTAYAFGGADGGPLNWAGGIIYALPVVVWLMLDVLMKQDLA